MQPLTWVRFFDILASMSSILPEIIIASRDRAGKLLKMPKGASFDHILSIGAVGEALPAGYRQHKAHKLRLEFDDIDPDDKFFAVYERAEDRAASKEQIESLIQWCNRVTGRTLIHCAAGISRSSASACVLTAIKLGPGKEVEAVQHVYSIKSDIWPNGHVIRLADAALGRNGALSAAFSAYLDSHRYVGTAWVRVTGSAAQVRVRGDT